MERHGKRRGRSKEKGESEMRITCTQRKKLKVGAYAYKQGL